MKKRVVILAAIAVGLLLAAFYLRARSSVPPGQEPLTVLSTANFTEFTSAFDRASDAPRIVLLLSPT
jgi:hypothetical protein